MHITGPLATPLLRQVLDVLYLLHIVKPATYIEARRRVTIAHAARDYGDDRRYTISCTGDVTRTTL